MYPASGKTQKSRMIPDGAQNNRVGFVGSFFEDTGIQDLVKALIILNREKPVQGVFVGDGPLIKEVKEIGLEDRILFPGRKPQEYINTVLIISGVAVVPFNLQRLNEIGSAALKVYEYFATGINVFA